MRAGLLVLLVLLIEEVGELPELLGGRAQASAGLLAHCWNYFVVHIHDELL